MQRRQCWVLVLGILLGYCCLPIFTWSTPAVYTYGNRGGTSYMYSGSKTRASYCNMVSKDAATLAEFSRKGKSLSDVYIESPSMNSRKITASIVIDSSMNHVWSILTDYNNLAAHVPNLVQSKLVPSPSGSTRLFQEGAQKIIGFDFRASLFMDMKELQPANEVDDVNGQDWRIAFACVQSRMFDKFDGEWILRPHSRVMSIDPVTRQSVAAFRTKLTYQVFVRPKGPVPVMALEWRIKEDIPVNLYAVKLASETISNRLKKEGGGNNKPATGGSSSSTTSQMSASTTPGIAIGANKSRGINLMNWSEDETLSQYINHKPASSPSPSSLLSNTKPMTTKDWIDGQQRLGSSFLPF